MKCAIPSCQMTQKCKNPRFFIFPKNKYRRKMWLRNCNLGPVSAVVTLCEAHFDESQFEEQGKYCLKKLKPNAVPTLFSWNMPGSVKNQTVKSSNMFVPFKKKRKRMTCSLENYDYGHKRQCVSSESEFESDTIDYFDKVHYSSSVEDTENTCDNIEVYNEEKEYELQRNNSMEILKQSIPSSVPVVVLERLNNEVLKSYLVNEENPGSEVDSENEYISDKIRSTDKIHFSPLAKDCKKTVNSVKVHNKEMEYELQWSDIMETLKQNIPSSEPVVWLERLNDEVLKSSLVNEETPGSEVDSKNEYVYDKVRSTDKIQFSPLTKDCQEAISSVKESFQEESASDKKQSVTPLQYENKTVFVSEDTERTRLSVPIKLLNSTCQLNYRKNTDDYVLPFKDVKSNYLIAKLKWTNKLLLDDKKIFEEQYKIVNSKKRFLLQKIVALEKENVKMRCESEIMQQIMVKYKKHNQTLWQKLLMIENDRRRKQRRHEMKRSH